MRPDIVLALQGGMDDLRDGYTSSDEPMQIDFLSPHIGIAPREVVTARVVYVATQAFASSVLRWLANGSNAVSV